MVQNAVVQHPGLGEDRGQPHSDYVLMYTIANYILSLLNWYKGYVINCTMYALMEAAWHSLFN